MALRKGFGPITCVINPDLSLDKDWYELNHHVCAMSTMRYFMVHLNWQVTHLIQFDVTRKN